MRRNNGQRQNPNQYNEINRENIEKVVMFLKMRFTDYTIVEIVFSLTQQMQQDRYNHRNPEHFEQFFPGSYERFERNAEQEGERVSKQIRGAHGRGINAPQEMIDGIESMGRMKQYSMMREEERRFVAKIFCKTGDCYTVVKELLPNLTASLYKSYITTISGEALKQMKAFIRYNCNIQTEWLDNEAVKILVGRLRNVRDWLGMKKPEQLATYFKFIRRRYEDAKIDISYDEALELHRSFLEITKSPNINIMDILDDGNDRTPPPYVRADQLTAPLQSYKKVEEKQVISTFLKCKTLVKTSQQLVKIYGEHNIKWAVKSIRELLVYAVKKALKKAILARNESLKNAVPIHFIESDSLANKIFSKQSAADMRDRLLTFFILNKIGSTQLIRLISEINSFQESDLAEDDEISIVPKVEFDHASQRANEEISIIPKVEYDHNVDRSIANRPSVRGRGRRNQVAANGDKEVDLETDDEEVKQEIQYEVGNHVEVVLVD